MPQYAFIFRGGGIAEPSISPSEIQAHLERWKTWVQGFRDLGIHGGGNALQTSGKMLRGKNQVLSDGPYAESKDLVTGVLVVEAPDIDKAVELARGCPVYEYGGSLEVRPVAYM